MYANDALLKYVLNSTYYFEKTHFLIATFSILQDAVYIFFTATFRLGETIFNFILYIDPKKHTLH